MVVKLDPDGSFDDIVEIAKEFLLRGEIIICPTDTIYGFACIASRSDAIEKIYKIKGGKKGPLLILILQEWVNFYVENAARFESLFKLWDKKVTLILPGKAGILPEILYNESGGIGIRAPRFPFIVALLRNLGEPIVSTSVNKYGENPLCVPAEIFERFGGDVPLIVDAGVCDDKPSTIIDCLNLPVLKVLREGSVSVNELKRELPLYEII